MTASPRTGTTTNPRTRVEALFGWLAVLAAVPVVVLSVFRAIPAEWPVLVVQLLAFTPWLAVPAVFALAFAFLSRRRPLQIAAGVLLVCQLFWLFPLDGGRPAWASQPVGAVVEFKAMSINAEFGQADAGALVELVRDNGIGVLTIQENTPGLQERLAEQGMERILPHRISDPTDDGAGSAVYSRYPLEPAGLIPDTPFRMPTVRLTGRSGGATAVLEVTSVHALPPIGSRLSQWRSDLAAVGKVAQRPGHRLLAGDYNATLDHVEFRKILSGGYAPDAASAPLADVAALAGSRLVPTWPMEGQALPGITIDHLVISAGVGSSGYAVHRVPGTDHAAIMATLSVPAN